jgi:hypothetical protein
MVGFLFADIRAVSRASIPAFAAKVIDAGWRIEPNDGIRWAMCLGLLLSREKREGRRFRTRRGDKKQDRKAKGERRFHPFSPLERGTPALQPAP